MSDDQTIEILRNIHEALRAINAKLDSKCDVKDCEDNERRIRVVEEISTNARLLARIAMWLLGALASGGGISLVIHLSVK